MYTRFLQFEIKPEMKNEFLSFTKKQIIPILTKQPGFVEFLPFFPEQKNDHKVFSFTLWNKKTDAERYERDWYPKIAEMLKPYIVGTPVVRFYHLEDTLLCKEFAHSTVA
jgi:quinol monooxygenase YgiN